MSRYKQVSKLLQQLGTALHANTKRHYSKILITTGLFGFGGMFYLSLKKHQRLKAAVSNQATRENNFIVDVTRKCSPSVVAIEVKHNQMLAPDTGDPMVLSSGSGFIISDDGWILSNAHVVMNKPNALVCVVTAKGAAYTATVHDIDLKHDLALLKIPVTGLPSLALGNSSQVSTGEWVVALGNPLSLKHTITAGVISSVDRDARELGITSHSMKYIQTDASITFGHSGGPLVNLDGEVIGINNLKITAGIAFAIPIDYAKEFLGKSSMYSANKLSEVTERPFLGITALEMNTGQWYGHLNQEDYDDNSRALQGVFVCNVASDSAAEKAGLKMGDIITHINEILVTKTSSIYASMSDGRKSVFTVYRPGIKECFYIEIPT